MKLIYRVIENPKSPSPSVHFSTNWIDQVFDDVDVGQCEIPWEDLVIGERTRLGKAHSWLGFIYFGGNCGSNCNVWFQCLSISLFPSCYISVRY